MNFKPWNAFIVHHCSCKVGMFFCQWCTHMQKSTHKHTHKATRTHQPWGYLQDRMHDGAGGRKSTSAERRNGISCCAGVGVHICVLYMMLICHPLAPNCISISYHDFGHTHTHRALIWSLLFSHKYTYTKVAVCHNRYGDHRKTVSLQCSLINMMVCSLPQGWANQARGHKSLPAGDAAEGHQPLFIGNLSPNYLDRESNMLDTGRARHHVCSWVC